MSNDETTTQFEKIPNISQAIFFIIIGIFIGAVCRELHKSRFKIPYTPLLMAIGLLMGSLNEHFSLVGSSTRLLTSINPDGILLVFLPILIFESSFNSDWHIFKRSLYQILVFAIPGVVLCFAIQAFTLKIVLGYKESDLTWSGALTLGTITAATDPVAVVALLKELGANHYFSTILEGESLINDGSALIFFSIFYKMAKGDSPTIGEGISQFMIITFGGVGIGLGIGILADSWLRRITKDSVLSITIIVLACYTTFFIAASLPVSFSAILALCSLGLYLSSRSKTLISKKIEHPLHSVIGWSQYISETLIFLLTGCIVGAKLIAHPESTIVAADWFKTIGFYIGTILSRFVCNLILWPCLQKGCYKFNWKEYIVMSYAGLRGALGLVLGLIIIEDPSFDTPERKRMGELILFHVAGLATLTLLINGSTTGILVVKTKMIKFNSVRRRLLHSLINEINLTSADIFSKLKEDNPSALSDWEKVKQVTGLKEEHFQPDPRPSVTTIENSQEEQIQMTIEARHRYLQNFIRILWEKFEKNQIPGEAANLLHKAVKVSQDTIENKVQIFEFLYSYFVQPRYLKIYTKLSKLPCIGRFFKQMIADHLLFIVDVVIGLLDIVEELRDKMEHFPMSQTIFQEFESTGRDARTYLNDIESQFDNIIGFVTTKHFTKIIFGGQLEILTDKYMKGELEEKEYEQLTESIQRKINNFQKLTKINWVPPSFASLVASFPLFKVLTDQERGYLLRYSETKTFKNGTVLLQKNTDFTDVYLILKGEVEVKIGSYVAKRGVGSIISFANLLSDDRKSFVDCKVTSQTMRAQVIQRSGLRKLMTQHNDFGDLVLKEAAVSLRHLNEEPMSPFGTKFKEALRESEVRFFTAGDEITLKYGGFILKGKLKADDIVFSEFHSIPHIYEKFQAESDGEILVFKGANGPRKRESIFGFGFDNRL